MLESSIRFSFLLIVFLGFKREFNSYSFTLISTFLTLILLGERFKNESQRGICGSAGVAQPGQSARLIGPLPFGGA